ncbi:MAG: hypothetical protein COV34_02710 [Candidatus Zambryskibacteria bacterium CG10_big_fil_rev_8_21_14_0_10_42_12]|uniref:Multidrug resistance protein MdtA-like barrel-sandwich hybrid domain-containing protein n=1 Tax=Candidatus Zambryskibacteria bacterium CG10_big_fil_rev_8_21_14_0_10_42_12 TaxID=1975115 RepID=A0A2H0QVX5_9BACT|nr:MAG: hypothetical protein COV34_02710 [Candidatus Zambryskibacteria bacterium CG10_big_fil_rev_8_21_14_0_10_42_12]
MRRTTRHLFSIIRSFIRDARTNRKKRIALIIVLVALGFIIFNAIRNNAPAEKSERSMRTVTLRTIAELSGNGSELAVTGTVESQSEADIRAEASGQVVSVRKNLGDRVVAGEIIAEIENNFERAQVAQAQASVDAAVAARQESSSLTDIRLDNATHALEQERVSAYNTVQQAYTLAENAVYGKADQFFTAPRTSAPRLNISSYGIDDLEERRAEIGDSFIVWKKMVEVLSPNTSIDTSLSDAEARLRFISSFMRDLAEIVTRQGSSTEVSDILSARTSIDTALANVSSGRESLRSAETTYRLAVEDDAQAAGSGNLSTRDAAVRQAEAGRALAVASLEKKIIRAPLSGTINSLSIDVGDVVAPNQPVAVVANNNALLIKTYITEQEKAFISVGNTVRISDEFSGVVTRIAPALDPVTRKIEVIIGVSDSQADLVNGQSVRVSIARTGDVEDVNVREGVRIPIASLNIGTKETAVFGIDENNMIVSYPVEIGPVFGDSVLITGDLDPLLRIVTDARGLKVGEKVSVSQE